MFQEAILFPCTILTQRTDFLKNSLAFHQHFSWNMLQVDYYTNHSTGSPCESKHTAIVVLKKYYFAWTYLKYLNYSLRALRALGFMIKLLQLCSGLVCTVVTAKYYFEKAIGSSCGKHSSI